MSQRIPLFLLCFMVMNPSIALAQTFGFCRCLEPGTPQQELGKATGVFTGKVKRVRWYGGEFDHVFVDVGKIWKGPKREEIKLLTDHAYIYKFLVGDITCSYPFKRGEEYLIYTYTDKASPQKVSRCGRTKRLSEAKEDLKDLGKPAFVFSDE